MKRLGRRLLHLITVEKNPKDRRQHGLTTRMYIHRGAYALATVGMCGLIYLGAYWLYQQNLTNPKTLENYFLSYKVTYDYNRYLGESRFASLRDTFGDKVQATPAEGYAESVPVLLYHRIASDNDQYNVTPAAFEKQMFALKRAGYTTVSADDYAAFLNGTKKLPAKSILITFDDGTKDSYYPVDPILKALDFRATNFIITKYSLEYSAGSHYYLSAIELKAMERAGRWDLEPHADVGHSYFQINSNGKKGEFYPNKLWLADKNRMETDAEYATRVYNDIAKAKTELTNFTHKPMDVFAFPFADIGENNSSNYPNAPKILTGDAQRLFKATMLLYYAGRSQSQGYYNSKMTDTYRIQLQNGQWTDGRGLVSFLQNGAAKLLPYADDLATDQGWQNAWGKSTIQNGTMELSGDAGSTGAGVILDGGSDWSNYTVSARATLVKGTSFGLLARMQSNYRVGCYFGEGGYVSITRTVGRNAATALVAGNYAVVKPNQTETFGARVAGKRIQCIENNKVIVQTTDRSMANTGTIGFSVWDPHKSPDLELRQVRVVPQ